ncbi:MAG: SOS response-associated peptidase [Gammaproteobacteria bacterium]|nr:SOS response-associated peptidase [Gammaproteobacteria bacterium]NNF60856.1 SOS response-associated peptidase [Gammaproteobacteria bacterium]NNM21755.1 SOS response-associated peptidase [Gammaproteobacteria bacterium]
MCGRFAFYAPAEAVTRIFGVEDPPDIEPRFNIAPTQFVPIIRADSDGERSVSMLRWGLVPFWAKDKAIGNRMINARAETLSEKPAYKSPFRKRRCIVPANGFYEWKKQGSVKQPYFISHGGDKPFGMAGLWARWRDGENDDETLETFTIVTTAPNEAVAPLHNRMPAIIDTSHFTQWLDPENHDTAALQELLLPPPAEPVTVWPVSRRVNDPKNDEAELVTADSLI